MIAALLTTGVMAFVSLRSAFARDVSALLTIVRAHAAGSGDPEAPVIRHPDLARIADVSRALFATLSAERASLQSCEYTFSRVFENAPVMVSLSEIATGRFYDVNAEFVRVTGFNRYELIGRTSLELGCLTPVERERITDAFGDSNRVREMEITLTGKDGREIQVLFFGEIVPVNGVLHLLSILQEITERKRLEQSQRESEARFRAVVENSHDSILFTDAQGRITYRSPGSHLVAGYANDERVGQDALEAVHPEDLPRLRQQWAFMLQEPERPIVVEARVRHKDGSWLHYEAQARNMLHNPSVRAVVVTSRDITLHKRAEEEHRRLQTQLLQSQKLEAIGQLAGGIAHDFNNILTTITLNLELLIDDPAVPSRARTGLTEMQSSAGRGASLTRQLLMFSRRQAMDVQRLELNGLVANLTTMLGRLIGEHIDIDLDVSASELWISADAGMLEQLITNLVVNARDAMPAGGRIVLRTSAIEVRAVAVRHPEALLGQYVCLEVVDSGHGIPDSAVRHIFEPFFTTKPAGEGTGLGLATVHGIARQHRGWVELETAVDIGSTFRVLIPAAAPARRLTPATGTSIETVDGGRERLLVVEDDDAVRAILVKMLSGLGYSVTVAANGSEALELWRADPHGIDLVLSDVVMPGGISGVDLAERLLAERPELKIVLMSGYSSALLNTDVLKRSGVSFQQKPLQRQALARRLREALESV